MAVTIPDVSNLTIAQKESLLRHLMNDLSQTGRPSVLYTGADAREIAQRLNDEMTEEELDELEHRAKTHENSFSFEESLAPDFFDRQ